MTTYFARKEYVYSGGDAIFSIPFSYIKKEHISVLVNNEATENYTYLNNSQIQVNDTLETNDVVSIIRSTPIDSRMVVFSDTSILDKKAQNLAQEQVFDAIQEVYDNNIKFNIDTLDILEANKEELEQTIADNKQELLDIQSSFESEVTQTIADNKQELENAIQDFEDEVNETIDTVREAAEKVNELEEAVEEAKTAAQTATNKADETSQTLDDAITEMDNRITAATTSMNQKLASAQQAAEDATEQAELASDKVDEAEEVIASLTPVVTQEIADRIADTNRLQNQINYLQTKAVGVFSEYLNFLRAGSTHTALKIGENVSLKFKLGTEECLYSNSADDEFDVIDKLDSGSSLQAGKDYCVYMKKLAASATGFDFVVSLNGTYPTGYTADEVYKIGGFHTLCLGVTSSNAPALKTGSFWSTHPAIGYNTADIIPNSVWCLTHRPISEPNGMVYVDRRGKWFDIYLQSGTFSGTASVFGGTTTDSRQPILHQYDLLCVFKEMMDDEDFMTAMEGSNQGTNIAGSADPVTTGGHTDTAGKRMTSGYFIEDGCGALWQWLKEIGFNGNQNWTGYGTNADQRGQTYGMPYVLLAGGSWDAGSRCGSWCRHCDSSRSDVAADSGCRGVSRSLFIGKVA